LYVYTVTPTSITEAPGSPYQVPEVPGVYEFQGVIVIPKVANAAPGRPCFRQIQISGRKQR